MPHSLPTTSSSPPTVIAMNPDSSNFFLAQDSKNGIVYCAQIRKPTMAEKFIKAIKRGLKGRPPPNLVHMASIFASVIDAQGASKRNTAMVEMVRLSRTAQSIARTQGTGKFGMIIGSLGMAAWMWKTGGREILMERAKAKKVQAEAAATPKN